MRAIADDADEGEKFCAEVGARLRKLRLARGLSLQDVARMNPDFTFSALGGWERGIRSISVPRFHALAAFYNVPVAMLLGAKGSGPKRRRLVLDLEALKRSPSTAAPVSRFARSIVVARGDYNGRVLTLRDDDLYAISAMIGVKTHAEVFSQLEAWGVLAGETT